MAASYFAKILVFIYGAVFLVGGGYAFLYPESFALSIWGLDQYSDAAINEMRAVYGGIQCAVGIVYMMAVFSLVNMRALLGWSILFFSCLGVARGADMVWRQLSFDLGGHVGFVMGFELLFLALFVLAYVWNKRSASGA